jgi:hypothetical protein
MDKVISGIPRLSNSVPNNFIELGIKVGAEIA